MCRDKKAGTGTNDSARLKNAKTALKEAIGENGYLSNELKQIPDSNTLNEQNLKQHLKNIAEFIQSFQNQIKKTKIL